ncbi:MAG: anthranilate synthase component I family protein [Chitinophagales bacterium]|nr:anthranilate synthase component I family protein [Chitinophagales bacterium]
MRKFYPIEIHNEAAFKKKLLLLSEKISPFCYLDSNNYPNYPYAHFGTMVALGALETFSCNTVSKDDWDAFMNKPDWKFGFVTYDYKNQVESGLVSEKFDGISMPTIHFFIPKYLISFYNEKIEIGVTTEADLATFYAFLEAPLAQNFPTPARVQPLPRISKEAYLQHVADIQHHIKEGDIYEMNYCMEFFSKDVDIQPVAIFEKLCHLALAPFSVFFRLEDKYLLCSSPERYLKRSKQKLVSQPIKGTIKRGDDEQQDRNLAEALQNNEKERAENIMIVDLVRNDLAKIATKNSVAVEELCGLYTFKTVHQLISTVSCLLSKDVAVSDIFEATFPMGSMTGAPKRNAMIFAEQYEQSKRGLYSGTVGYVTPAGNFDFNVVIRSILYNETNRYVSLHVGSAITAESKPEQEYEECLLKAESLLKAL